MKPAPPVMSIRAIAAISKLPVTCRGLFCRPHSRRHVNSRSMCTETSEWAALSPDRALPRETFGELPERLVHVVELLSVQSVVAGKQYAAAHDVVGDRIAVRC